ncbi:hypothetical protein K438DRAFT_1833872 [Mycena galopus ATCC 62051]|nr:hypothetical protein K438DRAFT_1833872 [Mycena galopus ATCC 62051]
MARYCYGLNKTWDDRVIEDIIVIWNRWEPACDSCGFESSLGEKLLCCSYCRVARYCSPKCQKYDWMDGTRHRDRCHLFEVDRKLSDEFKSIEHFGPPGLLILRSRCRLLCVVIRQEQRSDSEHRGEIVSVEGPAS